MVCSTSYLSSITTRVSYTVKLPNGAEVPVTHIGNVQVTENLLLTIVLCVPSFTFNLLSAKKLAESLSYCLIFLSNLCFIQDLASWITIGMGEVRDGLYHLLDSEVPPSALVDSLSKFLHKPPLFSAFVLNDISGIDLWHYRLGHISHSRLKLIDDPVVQQANSYINEKPCFICPLAKKHRHPFPISNYASSAIFELVHCDI